MEYFKETDQPQESCLFIESDQTHFKKYFTNKSLQEKYTVLLFSVLQYFYKSICFSIILSDIYSDIYNLKESIQKTRELLRYHQENIDKKIEENTDILSNGNSAKELLPLILSHLEPSQSIDHFTQIDPSVIMSAGRKSKQVEKLTEINMIVAFSEINLKKLYARKENFFNHDQEMLSQIEKDLSQLDSFLEESKLLESCFNKINSLESFKRYLTIDQIIKNKTSEFFTVKRLISETSEKNRVFSRYLDEIKNEDAIYDQLIEKHKMLEQEKVLESIYLQDLENLKRMETENNKELMKFTPYLIIRFFEDNLEIIFKNLLIIIEQFNLITIEYSKNFHQEITNLKFSKINKENFSDLKSIDSKYKLSPDQCIFKSNIEYLNKNFENLLDSVNSLVSDSTFNVKFKKAHFFPLHFQIFPLEYHQEFTDLKEKLLIIQNHLENISNKLDSFSIKVERAVVGFGYNGEQKVNTSQSNRSSSSIDIRGVINVELSRETYEKIDMAFNFKCLYYDQIFQLEKSGAEIQEKISKINQKISNKEKISENISVLESILCEHLSFKVPVFDSVPDFEYQEFMKDRDVSSLIIEKEFIVPTLGIIFSRINFKKNKFVKAFSKPHKRTYISIKFFFETLWKAIHDADVVSENTKSKILLKICGLKSINLGCLVCFLISEDIVGSYLSSKDVPQKVVNKKVEEDYDKSLFVICQNISVLALKQNSTNDEINNKIRVLDEMTEYFWKVIKKYRPKWEKDLRASFSLNN